MNKSEQEAVATFTKTVQGAIAGGTIHGSYLMDIQSAIHILGVLQQREAEIGWLRRKLESGNQNRLHSEKQPAEVVECTCSGHQLFFGECVCGARK